MRTLIAQSIIVIFFIWGIVSMTHYIDSVASVIAFIGLSVIIGIALFVYKLIQVRRERTEGSTEAPIIPNCPINEQTGDGVFVGRCWFALQNGSICPRHGDVKEACSHYLETNELTPEEVHRNRSFPSFYRPSN